MHETERDGAVASAVEKAVLVEKRLGKAAQPIPQSIGRVEVVMKVDLNVPKTAMAQLRERVEELWPISFLRKEERVLRGSAVAVGESLRHSRVFSDPCRDPRALNVDIDLAMGRLKMIGDAEKNISYAIMTILRQSLTQSGRQQRGKPELSVSGE